MTATKQKVKLKGTATGVGWPAKLTAVVAVAGLLWGVLSFFIGRADTSKTSDATTAKSQISVQGEGNLAVGSMSGGTINQGTPPPLVPNPPPKSR